MWLTGWPEVEAGLTHLAMEVTQAQPSTVKFVGALVDGRRLKIAGHPAHPLLLAISGTNPATKLYEERYP